MDGNEYAFYRENFWEMELDVWCINFIFWGICLCVGFGMDSFFNDFEWYFNVFECEVW